MIVHDPNGNIWGIDFRETAPMKSSKEDWAEKVELGEYRHFTYMPLPYMAIRVHHTYTMVMV